MAGCGGSFLYSLCITISVTVITYNIIVSSNTTLSSGFPTSRKTLASPALSDPVIRMPVDRASSAPRRPFHTAVTSSDSLYNTWQSRVMYYWFKKARAAAGPGSEMGGFTRILHSGKPDRFMDEIPTFVADPLPPGSDQSRSLFLKNLNFKTNDDSLREHFSGKIRKGSIRSVKVKKHVKNGKNVSMGSGFIEFDSLETSTSVCQDFQGSILDGHALILQLSCQKRRPCPEEE